VSVASAEQRMLTSARQPKSLQAEPENPLRSFRKTQVIHSGRLQPQVSMGFPQVRSQVLRITRNRLGRQDALPALE